jgi:hypothetical protein
MWSGVPQQWAQHWADDARNLTRAEGSDVSTDRDNTKTTGGLEKKHKVAIQKTIKEVTMELSKGVTKNEIIKKKAVKKRKRKRKRKRKKKTTTQHKILAHN